MNCVLMFDLEGADSEDYSKAHEILANAGFVRQLPSGDGGTVPLPSTTAVAQLPNGAAEVRDWAWNQFQAGRLNPKRMFVAKYDDYAAKGRP